VGPHRQAGEVEEVTLHGLRHWFASAATELGYSDLIIGALLGHAKRGITGRYATALDPALIAAADKISTTLMLALDGKADEKVISMPSVIAR
jgi:integrase